MNKLKELRKAAGLTQQQLADSAGIFQQQIARLENGQRTTEKMSLGTAVNISKVLNCHAEELIESE